MMKHDSLASDGRSNGSRYFSAPAPVPMEVFYVVETTGVAGERDHHLCSALYETRPQAHVELVRLQTEASGGCFSVWKSSTYVEPAEWRHRVVRADGTLILPRLHGVEKSTDD